MANVAGMNRRRRNISFLLTLFLLAGLILCGLVRLWPRTPLLLKQATRIADLPLWSHYAWLSSHQILLFQLQHNQDARYDLFIVDTISGKRTPCTRLQSLFNVNLEPGPTSMDFYPQVSPDGTKLLWPIYQNRRRHWGERNQWWVLCATLEGKLLSRNSIEENGASHRGAPDAFFWLPGGQEWAETIRPTDDSPLYYDRLYVRAVGKPHIAQVITLPRNHTLKDFDNGRWAFTEGRLLAVNFDYGPDQYIASIDEYRFDTKVEWLHRYPAPTIPQHDRKFAYANLSSTGRMCWQVGLVEPVSPLFKFLHRFVPSLPSQDRKVTGIFIGDRQGKDIKEIGTIEYPGQVEYPPLRELVWSPDEKHISFIHKDVLYTVPTDAIVQIVR